jgi:hypothetical protein
MGRGLSDAQVTGGLVGGGSLPLVRPPRIAAFGYRLTSTTRAGTRVRPAITSRFRAPCRLASPRVPAIRPYRGTERDNAERDADDSTWQRREGLTVITARICSFRAMTGTDSPPVVSDDAAPSLLSTAAWKDRHGHDAHDRDRDVGRGQQRAAGTAGGEPEAEQRRDGQRGGDPDEPARRLGGPAASLIASTMLVRAARRAGTSATATTVAAVAAVSDGVLAAPTRVAPTRAAPGLVMSGAASHPAASPPRRASSEADAPADGRLRRAPPPAPLSLPGSRASPPRPGEHYHERPRVHRYRTGGNKSGNTGTTRNR